MKQATCDHFSSNPIEYGHMWSSTLVNDAHRPWVSVVHGPGLRDDNLSAPPGAVCPLTPRVVPTPLA